MASLAVRHVVKSVASYTAFITFSSSSLHFASESFAPRTMLVEVASLPAELETSASQHTC